MKFELSPTLLRWLTSNSVLDGSKISYEERSEVYYYDQDELMALNKKMEGKWPKTAKGQRPHIPEGIKREIRHEARSACPVCNKSHGEIAHIDCVAATHCNHPKNLIFLCPDHHTEYDNARIPANIDREEVIILKNGLKIVQRQLWRIAGELIGSYLSGLNAAKSLLDVHEVVRKIIPDAEFQSILDKIATSTEVYSDERIDHASFLSPEFLNAEIDSYIEKNQEHLCPLCEGHGATSFYDPCPVCLGDGEIDPELKERIDLSDYSLIDCGLCSGSGIHEGQDCPACRGDGQVSQGFYDNHDWSMYDLVKCRLCDGSGNHNGDECPPCGGEGLVSQSCYDNHDWSRYELVKCRLCEGTATHDGDDCPACNGEGEVSQGFYDHHDWAMYDSVTCRLCDGTGKYDGDYCPPCIGEGQVTQGFYENHDWAKYHLMTCKLCDGSGDHNGDICPPCRGEGKVTQGFFYDFDWSKYETVECQLCKGEGRYHANDCSPCRGEGRVSQKFNRHHNWRQYK